MKNQLYTVDYTQIEHYPVSGVFELVLIFYQNLKHELESTKAYYKENDVWNKEEYCCRRIYASLNNGFRF